MKTCPSGCPELHSDLTPFKPRIGDGITSASGSIPLCALKNLVPISLSETFSGCSCGFETPKWILNEGTALLP